MLEGKGHCIEHGMKKSFTCKSPCSQRTRDRTRRKSLICRMIRFCSSTVSFKQKASKFSRCSTIWSSMRCELKGYQCKPSISTHRCPTFHVSNATTYRLIVEVYPFDSFVDAVALFLPSSVSSSLSLESPAEKIFTQTLLDLRATVRDDTSWIFALNSSEFY